MKAANCLLSLAAWCMAIFWFSGCASPKPSATTDPELSRVAGVARMSFEQGSLEQSARLYARALRMARTMDDAREIGNNAYNLAACLTELGRYSEALGFLYEARAEFDRMNRPIADVLLLEAKIALLDGRLDDVVTIGNQVVAAASKRDQGPFGVQVRLLLADVAVARGSVVEAKEELERAGDVLTRLREPLLNAQAAGVEARILLAEGSPEQAAEAFDRQSELLRGVARFREMAHTLGRAGAAYQQAGTLVTASDRFYRAARSLYAQGDDLEALKMIQVAVSISEESGDQDALPRIAALFEEVRKRVEGVKNPTSDASKE